MSTIFIGGPTVLGSTGARIDPTGVVTSGSSYSVSTTDVNVVINKTSGSVTSVILPSSPTNGRTIIIKDGKGDASTNNITVIPASGNIDGDINYIMNINYQSVGFIYNGTTWSVV